QTEWWYFTGHLRSAEGRRFGYQFTFFRVGLLAERPPLDSQWAAGQLIMGHAALSELDGGQHYFSEVLYRVMPLLGGFGVYPDSLIGWSRGPAGTAARWTLRWNGAAFDLAMVDEAQGLAIELQTQPLKALVFQGPGGYSRKGEGPSAASQYYSFTRLATQGTLRVGGEEVAVQGESWMDQEFGSNQLGPQQVGWDWFSVQLDDGRELMLYLLRDEAGAVDHARGTLIEAGGAARYLERGEFVVTVTDHWTSPQTGAQYPAGWTVRVGSEGWTLKPLLADQENWGAAVGRLFYWEGAVAVRDQAGHPCGKGYVELTGYGTGIRPGI
ncbi:MAG: carotenoid 1,2-hydratase, partial [Candidatus Latescibacteria bacterium]|nr:carotenoid 1,2-hydratase [Candidatus Latescibacterota bacterium]